MKTKIISLLLIMIFLITLFGMSTSASEQTLDVELDSENSCVSIYYESTAHSNKDAGVSITRIDGTHSRYVYFNQVRPDSNGNVIIEDIPLPEDGKYLVKIIPQNSKSVCEKTVTLMSNDNVDLSYENVLAAVNNYLTGDIRHPYIHCTYNKIMQIKANVENNDYYSVLLYNKVKSEADNLLKLSPSKYTQVTQSHIGVDSKIMALMTAYFVDGNEKYLNRAIAEFEALQSVTVWTAAAQLDNTQTAAAIAVGYDWLYDYLSEEQKTWAVNVLKTKSLDIAHRYYSDPSTLNTLVLENNNMNIVCGEGSYNHNVYNNSNLCISALAIAPENPEYSAFIIYNNLYNIQPYLKLVGENGGHDETIGYYAYTTGKMIDMLSAVNSALNTTYGYDEYPGFKTTAYYQFYMYGVGPFAFGDTSPQEAIPDTNSLYFTAKLSNNAELLTNIMDRFENGSCAKVLLWYDKGELDNIDETAVLPYDRLMYPETHGQNVASFRNSWDIDTGLFTAMYVGCGTANGHSDAVSGAFCLDAFGERFITPVGLGNYNYSHYWDNSQNGGRWKWYEKRPEGNCCLVINPSEDVGQNVVNKAVFDGFGTSDGSAFAWSDLSSVYSDYASSYKRGIRLYDNRSRVLIQDEATMTSPSEVFWSVNTPAEIDIIDNHTAILKIDNKRVCVRFWSNTNFTLSQMASAKLPSSPYMAEQRYFPNYRKLAIRAENVTDFKLMAEFTPLDTEYDTAGDIPAFTSVTSWTADDEFTEKPTLDRIYVNGNAIDGFKNGLYAYKTSVLSLNENPVLTYDNPNGYDVNVSYPQGEKKAVLSVTGNGRTAYYTVDFVKDSDSINTTNIIVSDDKFRAAVYDTSDPDDVGTSEFSNDGWLPNLYSNGIYRQYYCTVNISELADKNIESAIYHFDCNGYLSIAISAVDSDFTPGVTPFKDLPMTSKTVTVFSRPVGGGQSQSVDFTDYIREALSKGKTSIGFVVVQTNASSTVFGKRGKSYLDVEAYDKKIEYSDICISEEANQVSAEISITNHSDRISDNYNFILAQYTEDYQSLVDLQWVESGLILSGYDKTITATLDKKNNTVFKAFLWNDDFATLK